MSAALDIRALKKKKKKKRRRRRRRKKERKRKKKRKKPALICRIKPTLIQNGPVLCAVELSLVFL